MPLTLGTAGHVDHGKTRLVEALTATNTDRLPEERSRGISIELGYAELALAGGSRLSVIDVPGHERFVRTMVSGAAGIDLFLLAVDAGEGPRAQTYEHLEILRLLGVQVGVVALTKIDAVEPERRTDLTDLVPGAEVVPVSANTGEGIDELLRAALERAQARVERRPAEGPARLYVDRVFSLPGAGTIATGTLWSGTVGAGDRLEVLPEGFEARIRSVEVHGGAVERAEAGQRVAVAVAVEPRRSVARGDALVTPGAFAAGFRLDVELDGSVAGPAQVLHGTSALPGRVVPLGDRHAQLRLRRPIVAAAGDRLVLRRERTVGGAVVVDAAPPRHADPSRVGRAAVSAPVKAAELARRGVSLEGLERAGEWVFAPDWLEAVRARTREACRSRSDEVDPGLPATALLGTAAWADAVVPLLGLEPYGGKLYLPGRRPSSGAAGDELVRALESTGFEPLPVQTGDLTRQLEREGRLVRLGAAGAISTAAYERAKAALVEECQQNSTISLARFRDLLGVSRRVAQLILERLDADRVTLRIGDERRLRRSSAPR